MTKVKIEPGVCGFTTIVKAVSDPEDETDLTVHVASGCPSIRSMMEELGESFDAYEVCLQKPGVGPFYDYAKAHFPVHVSCPVINGILKCMEVEARLALKKDASIVFEEEPAE